MYRFLLLFLRITLIVIGVAFGLIATFLIHPILNQEKWTKIFVMPWAKYMIWSLGIKVHHSVNNDIKYTLGNIIVSNHISWIDILLILSITPVSFIAMIELKRWPIVSNLVKSAGTIFIDRKNRRDVIEINYKIKEKLDSRVSNIAFFPEGGIAQMTQMREFKAPLFQSIIETQAPVILIGIDYLLPNGQLAYAANYYGKTTIIQCLINVLKTPRINAKISCERLATNKSLSRDELAWLCQNKIKSLKEGNYHGITTQNQ